MLHETLEKLIDKHGELLGIIGSHLNLDWVWTYHKDHSINRLELEDNGWEHTVTYYVNDINGTLTRWYKLMEEYCKERHNLVDAPINALIDKIMEDLQSIEESARSIADSTLLT